MTTYPYNDHGQTSTIMNEIRTRTTTVGIPYCRLSMNRSGLSDSVAIQRRETSNFIEDEGWKSGPTFDDDDYSASRFRTKKERPNYNRLLEYVRRFQDDPAANSRLVIVVTEMPRLYREVEELLPLIKMAESTKLRAIWTTDGEGYDLSTPEGVHRAIGAVNNAMLESGRLSKRQRRKKKSQAEMGKRSGGARPFAYGVQIAETRDGKPIIDYNQICEPEKAIYLEAVERIIAGDAQMSVVKSFNATGKLTATGKPWQVGNLKQLLLKKRYVICGQHPTWCQPDCDIPHGVREHHPENGDPKREYPAEWPGLISAADYELMVSKLQRGAQQHYVRPLGIKGRSYLLSGIAHCGKCGQAMYGQRRTMKDGTKQPRYRCKAHDNYGNKLGCGRTFRLSAPLDDFIKEAVLDRFNSPQVAAALAAEPSQDDAQQLAHDLLRLKGRRKETNRKLGIASSEDAEDLAEQLQAIKDEQERVQRELSRLQQSSNADLLPVDGTLREAWARADVNWQRSIIELIVEKITVLPGLPGKKRYKEWGFDVDAIVIDWKC